MEMKTNKNILLIGGAGYVGTVLTFYLLKKGYGVTVLDNFIYGNQFSVQSFIGDPQYTLVNGDFGNEVDLARAAKDATDVVILGGLVGDPITKTYPEESNIINSIGIKTCIDFFDSKNIGKLIFISTCSNYGLIKDNEIADENFELNPLSLYAKAKVEAEKHILSKKGNANYTGVVLRFATAFGLSPRMRFDLSISEFTRELFFGNELLVFDEHTWRPYCHVNDFARLIELVINSEDESVSFEVFNAGGDVNNYTKKMIIDAITEQIPLAKINYNSNGSDPRNYRVSFNKVKTRLGFQPQYSVKDGISELVNAMKLGMFSDSLRDKKRYGNYEIDYVNTKLLSLT
jgi:nucleoside-diphosphate-sugar epimerase